MAHCWVPFMGVLWWRDPLIGSGPLLAAGNKVYWWSISGPLLAANDKFFYWSTGGSPSLDNRACRRWPNIGISVGPMLAATVGPMAFLTWV